MLKFHIFLFLLNFIIIHGNSQNTTEFSYHSCLGANFSDQTTYNSNLNLLLAKLSNVAHIHKFYNTSIGKSPNDAVYGLFQCQGSNDDDSCQACVAKATRDTSQRNCSLRKGAVAWYDECILRYSDQPFRSVMSTRPRFMLPSQDDIGVDPVRLNQLVMSTLKDAAGWAANGSSPEHLFAAQSINFTSNITLYTLAQCTGDLSDVDCLECLTQSIDLVPDCCTDKRGGRVLFPSCYVRYEVFPFYRRTFVEFYPEQVPKVLEDQIFSTGGSKSSAPIIVSIIVVPISFSILFFLGWWFLRRRSKIKKYTAKGDVGIGCS